MGEAYKVLHGGAAMLHIYVDMHHERTKVCQPTQHMQERQKPVLPCRWDPHRTYGRH